MDTKKTRLDHLKEISIYMEKDKEYWIDFLCKIEPLATAVDEVEKTIRLETVSSFV